MTNSKENRFIAVMQNGEVIERIDFSHIMNIPRVEYYLKAHYEYTFEGPSNTTNWYRYELIDKEEKPFVLKRGTFEVNYIDTDFGKTNFFSRKIHIYDNRLDKIYTYSSKCKGPKFLKIELIPLLEELDQFGSWEARNCYLENIELKKRIKQLTEKISQLDKS